MPELPEVEIVAAELRQILPAKTIAGIEVFWDKTLVNKTEIPIAGQRIRKITRKGKYLVILLDKTALIVHLRMTGQLLYNQKQERELNGHTRLILDFNDNSRLQFIDIRKFGRIYHVSDMQEILNKVGIDALDDKFDLQMFKALLARSSMRIKAFLLSQKYISGMGNIYVDESLFLAKIHPLSVTNRIKASKAKDLFDYMREVLKNSIANMGSTISDYRDAYGNSGNNQKYFKVYQKTGEPCTVCGTEISKQKIAGRSTHFCPSCQKKY